MNKIRFSVGICAYNEEQNIGNLLKSVLKQKLGDKFLLHEIIVISSACTDKTNDIVKEFQEKGHRIRLVIEKKRSGKASAVNKFIKLAKTRYLILTSADLLIEKGCFKTLLENLAESKIGLTAPRIIPLNKNDNLTGFAVHLQWNLHHKINLQFPERPKVGELIAFKKIFKRIPPSTAVDEASIEPLIYLQGYTIKYCPDAIVYNKGPETVHDFLRQRRRIYAGHTALIGKYGYRVVTYSNLRVIGTLISSTDWSRRFFIMVPAVIFLETIGRLFGFLDYKFKTRNHTVWKIAKTTKHLK